MFLHLLCVDFQGESMVDTGASLHRMSESDLAGEEQDHRIQHLLGLQMDDPCDRTSNSICL